VEVDKFYISTIMDLCNREIITFKMSAALVEATVKQAMKTRKLPDLTNIIIHYDQGSTYKWFKYKNLAKKLTLEVRDFSHLKTVPLFVCNR